MWMIVFKTIVILSQYDEIEPVRLLERCSLSESKYLLERCIGLIISKVSIICVERISSVNLSFTNLQVPLRLTEP